MDEIEGLHQMFQKEPTVKSDDEDSHGSISVAESGTTHDGGPEPGEHSTSSESDYEEDLHADVPGEAEQLNKGQGRRLLDAVQKVALTAEDEVQEGCEGIPDKAKKAWSLAGRGDLHMDMAPSQ